MSITIRPHPVITGKDARRFLSKKESVEKKIQEKIRKRSFFSKVK